MWYRRVSCGRGLISFVDITKDDYDQKEHGDVDFRSAMQRIHVILPDQRVVSGVEVGSPNILVHPHSNVKQLTKKSICGPFHSRSSVVSYRPFGECTRSLAWDISMQSRSSPSSDGLQRSSMVYGRITVSR